MYHIKELAELSGVTTRTLRYYDSIDLLKPKELSEAGYRLYGQEEAKTLQQILFLKELDFTLKETKLLIKQNNVDKLAFFEEQYQVLLTKRKQLDNIIELMGKTIDEEKGKIKMTDTERFTAFKEKLLKENNDQYGTELQNQYSPEMLKSSESKFRKLTEQELSIEMVDTEKRLFDLLHLTPEIPSENAYQAYLLHAKWLNYTLDLSPMIHRSLADMYLADERFTAYYDEKVSSGATQQLRDIIYFYTE